jgi:hypothetical protein
MIEQRPERAWPNMFTPNEPQPVQPLFESN